MAIFDDVAIEEKSDKKSAENAKKERKLTSFRFDVQLHKELKKTAAELDVAAYKIVEDALRAYLKTLKK